MIPIQAFPALSELPFLRHGFVGRIPGLGVKVEREQALARLMESHAQARRQLGVGDLSFFTAEQIHGAEVAVVKATSPACTPGADALVTNCVGACLGIYVADCAAVYLVDPSRRCIGLAHSGKKGTALGIVPATIEKMRGEFGADPRRMLVQISPCIRPPDYEIDFAAEIAQQCRDAGVANVQDGGENTARDLRRYYSYRAERGKTGRMLALLALQP